jgi:signal peptidase II
VGAQGLTRQRLTFLVAGVVVVLDQLTKAWAVSALADERITVIEGFLEFRLTRNTGAAFSSFQGLGPLIAILAVGVVGWITMMLRGNPRPLEAWALALVLGGALGNLLDRIVRGDGFLDGAVIDFIDLWFIPTFNIADMAITFGAGLLLLAALLSERS